MVLSLAEFKNKQLSEFADQAIQKGSKSFSLASRIFGDRERIHAHLLYTWCRHCDDAIDESPNPSRGLESVMAKTLLAFDSTATFQGDPVFAAFQQVARERQIPKEYALDLLDGMRIDVEGIAFESERELLYYCYCVAGAVGLMMAHVMGISDERALKHAVDLGIAFQLTNIARDVFTDAGMGRIYFPKEWLREYGVPFDAGLVKERRKDYYEMTKRLLKTADRHYASAWEGLQYLSLRAGFTIAAASEIYSAIGYKVIRLGPNAWENRVVVPRIVKLFLVAKAGFKMLPLAIERLFKGWHETRLSHVWRFQNEYREPN